MRRIRILIPLCFKSRDLDSKNYGKPGMPMQSVDFDIQEAWQGYISAAAANRR